MNYLLDTHTLIWAITDSGKLSKTARKLIEDSDNRVLVSAVSFWEISLKNSIGKLELENIRPQDFPKICGKMDFEILPLEAEICSTFHKLTAIHHKNPFDRMLVWLAIRGNLAIISKDPFIKMYEPEGLKVLWQF